MKKKMISLDTNAINDEMGPGGEKSHQNFNQTKLDSELNDIFDLALECVEYMKGEREASKDIFDAKMPIIPGNQIKSNRVAPPPSVKGNKKIDFSKTVSHKPSLDVIKENNNSSFGDGYDLSNSLDQASPEQTQQFALRTTPTNRVKSPEKTNEGEPGTILSNLDVEVESE